MLELTPGFLKVKRNSIKQLLQLGLVLVMGVSMSACSKTSWKEEVQLNDGRIIVIERETQHEMGGDEWASNRRGTKPKERRFRFTYPENSTNLVEWRSTRMDENRWPEEPLILDFEAGRPFVYSIVSTSIGCRSYVKDIFVNDEWKQESLPEKFEERKANLLIREDFDIPNLVTLEVKKRLHADAIGRQEDLEIGPSRKVCG